MLILTLAMQQQLLMKVKKGRVTGVSSENRSAYVRSYQSPPCSHEPSVGHEDKVE